MYILLLYYISSTTKAQGIGKGHRDLFFFLNATNKSCKKCSHCFWKIKTKIILSDIINPLGGRNKLKNSRLSLRCPSSL